jgi:hypothetical protein
MPINPDFPFLPADPSQWWQARGLPHILVQPNAPPNAGSTDPSGSDGIDDWFVPTPALDPDGLPNDWFVPRSTGSLASSNPNMPAPAAGSPPIFPSSNPFAYQNIPDPPPPFALNSRGQFSSAEPPPLDDVPPAAADGLFGGIGRMLAARAKPFDPFEAAANGMWGGIAKMIAANAAPDPGSRGFLGSLADLPVPPSAQAASLAPYSGPFLPSDPIGFPQSSALPDIELIADKNKGPRNLDLFDERAFGETPPLGSAAPRMLPPFGAGPRPPAPPPPVPQPPLRPPLSPASSLSPGALSSPSPEQGANSARAPGTPIEAESVTPPSALNEGDSRLNLPFGIGPGPYAGEPIPAGPGKRPSPAQQDQINASGAKYGCHTCGASEPGTPLGNWIGDHQWPTGLNPPGQPQYYLPHRWFCARSQGGLVTTFKRRGR